MNRSLFMISNMLGTSYQNVCEEANRCDEAIETLSRIQDEKQNGRFQVQENKSKNDFILAF